MTDEVLILMQGTMVRAACQRMESAHLMALSASVQQAACLPHAVLKSGAHLRSASRLNRPGPRR